MHTRASNTITIHRRASSPASRRQRGVALVVALVLLVVITLVGLAAIRGTLLQNKMAANLYDRQVAFQAAEAGMRAAMAKLASDQTIARECDQASGGGLCYANPFNDPNLPAGKIINVTTGNDPTQFDAGALAAGQPQYVVEHLGTGVGSGGQQQNATCNSYGAPCVPQQNGSKYYRITVRSAPPDEIGNRSVVFLQTMVKLGS
ncbi:pilus assembly PilX family protein [Aerosticca soli]|uniref:Type IV fimbrial biogenesis protein PilX n=1 Tax=Aerosticca soli TaxID=2010829 RepID=A0A2Z6E605_9GAMM|nr:PilX N-terminal domain-containing pilus assembly protein [Aerosticca soli]BBD80427.1 type IV fimbrial biogenesis protein PilX [Aerosticca soli]